MRIAIVGPTFPYKGGGAAHTTELAHRLADAGHHVTIESWSAQYPAFLYPGVQTVDVPDGPPFPATRRALSWRRPDGWLRAGRRIGAACDALVLAVLSPVQVPAYLGILRGARRAGVRTVALCHNVLPHERRAVDVTLMRALLRRTDTVLVHSDQQAGLARALLGPRARTTVRVAGLAPHLPDGAAPARSPAPAERPVTRRVLFFGMVRPYKGLDLLLRALARGPEDLRLTVAGEFWGGVEETERLITELCLTDRVELRPGYVPAADVPDLFARADALVLPYRSATASQNAWLGFAHGVPVIATGAGALADHVRDGVDGLLCTPGDIDDLATALARYYAPGEPERLRAGVRPVDPEPHWHRYLAAVTAACTS